VSFAAVTVCVASRQVFIVDVYFVIDSVRKLLDTPSCVAFSCLVSVCLLYFVLEYGQTVRILRSEGKKRKEKGRYILVWNASFDNFDKNEICSLHKGGSIVDRYEPKLHRLNKL
jgi:hypothetical protein